jgi:hypothetical protein
MNPIWLLALAIAWSRLHPDPWADQKLDGGRRKRKWEYSKK